MTDNDVIIRPLLTEKSTMARTVEGKYYFEVHKKATKPLIKQALENLFNVKVQKCNVSINKGKKMRTRYGYSYTKSVKKAVVTLEPGNSFDFYEGI